MTRRARIEALVEQLIGLLDAMEPDIEAEPGTWIERQTCREHDTVADENLEEQHDREWDAAEHGIADADAVNSEEFCFTGFGFDGSGQRKAIALLHLHDAHRYASGADMPTVYSVSAAR